MEVQIGHSEGVHEALGRREDTLSVLRGSPRGMLAEVSRYPDLADLLNKMGAKITDFRFDPTGMQTWRVYQ